jgi:hypothetical protein
MGEFKTWLESLQSRPVGSMDEAQRLSRSDGLETKGMEFNLIQTALERGVAVSYEDNFPLRNLGNVSAGDKSNLLQMMGAFANKMGIDPPATLQQAASLKIRDPEFKKMTPPIIINRNGMRVEDGVSRVNAARLLKVGTIRAFVIG